jgi:anti-sigma regulatory factor (Ser/Thr protein kinase)
MFYAVLDTRTFDCTFAKAGHNPPIWYHAADKSVEYLEVEGFPLGMFEFSQYEDHHISMKPMDKLVFYTDGITEAMNPNQDEYSLARLCTFIQDFHEFDSRSLIERLMMDVDEFTEGAPQHDDLTMIILSISSFELTKVEIESNRGAVVTFTEKFIAEMEEKSIEGMDHFEVTMILDELLINAAEHGNKFDTEKKVHIEYAILPYKVELIITDEGNGFDFEATFKEKEKITLYHKRGRGIQIVKQLVDKLEYSNHGRTCRMVKYLK